MNAAEKRQYRTTPKGRAGMAWSGVVARAGNRDGNHPAYRNVRVLMTREEFMAWAVGAIARWLRRRPGETPTVDRRDEAGHYEIANLRIVSRSRNVQQRRGNHNVHAPAGKAWCSGHRAYLPTDNFVKRRRSYNGRAAYCRACHAGYMRKRRRASQE